MRIIHANEKASPRDSPFLFLQQDKLDAASCPMRLLTLKREMGWNCEERERREVQRGNNRFRGRGRGASEVNHGYCTTVLLRILCVLRSNSIQAFTLTNPRGDAASTFAVALSILPTTPSLPHGPIKRLDVASKPGSIHQGRCLHLRSQGLPETCESREIAGECGSNSHVVLVRFRRQL